MKLIIDIDESLLDGIKSDNFDFARQVVRSFQGTIASSIANGTPIPDNATNGDVIINIFDVKEIHTMTTTVFTVLQDGTELEFKRSWWNAPYQN